MTRRDSRGLSAAAFMAGFSNPVASAPTRSGNPLTLERAMLSRQARGARPIMLADAADEAEAEADDFDVASEKRFVELDRQEADVPIALYAVLVFDARTAELLGKYPADSGDLATDRANAIEAATTDAEKTWDWCRGDLEGAGPPDNSQCFTHEEWR